MTTQSFGHDIGAAGNRAIDLGLHVDADWLWVVEVLRFGHSTPYPFRYPQPGWSAAIPDMDSLRPVLHAMVDEVANAISTDSIKK